MNKTKQPLWATPERQAILAELFSVFGNRCLLGHSTCFEASHYIHWECKTSWGSKAVYLPCSDGKGNPNGEYLKLYKPVKVSEQVYSYMPLYDVIVNQVVANWKDDDRELRKTLDLARHFALHSLGEQSKPLRGVFSAISKEIWGGNQPLYYLQGLGISGLTLQPFAKVKLASSYLVLYVDLGDILRQPLSTISKNKKRKALRYGKPLPTSIENQVNTLVSQAVRHYLSYPE